VIEAPGDFTLQPQIALPKMERHERRKGPAPGAGVKDKTPRPAPTKPSKPRAEHTFLF
jgi:hypothetical protein